jgi:hypothetical protein
MSDPLFPTVQTGAVSHVAAQISVFSAVPNGDLDNRL